MQRFKKCLIQITLSTFLFSLFIPGLKAGNLFPDLSDDHWSVPFFTELKDRYVFRGDAQSGNIRPNDTLNRAEAISIILRTGNIRAGDTVGTPPFTDLDQNAWYYDDVKNGYNKGYVTGYKNSEGQDTNEFKPQEPVTRAEFILMVYRAFQFDFIEFIAPVFTDTETHWARIAIETAWAYSVVDGVTKTRFEPNRHITRAEAAKILYNAFNLKLREELQTEDDTDGTEDTDEDTGTGSDVDDGDTGDEDTGTGADIDDGDTGTGSDVDDGTTDNEDVTDSGEGADLSGWPFSVQRIIVPGENYLGGIFTLSALYEPMRVKRMTYNITGSNYDGYFAEAFLFCPSDYEDPNTLDFMKQGGIINNQIVFDGLDCAIDDRSDMPARVYVKANSVDNAQESGRAFELKFTANNVTEFEAIGKYSQNQISPSQINNTDVEKITIRKGYPILTEISEKSILSLGQSVPVYRLRVLAYGSDIGFARLTFNVYPDGVDASGTWNLYRIGENNPIATSTLVNGKVVFDFPEKEVSDGKEKEYEVRAELKSQGAQDERILSLELARDTDEIADKVNNDNTGTLAEVTDPANSFLWSDQSGELHSDQTADWTNGYNIPNFPDHSVSLN